MRKLSLLKPDVKTTYLNCGKGDEVKYINIPERLGIKQLEKDVKAGGRHFEEVLELAKKRPSKVVIIDCTNEEQGLMAATYLASVYNESDGIAPEFREDYSWSYSEEEVDLEIHDFEFLSVDDLINNDYEGEEEDENRDLWIEDAYKLPVIQANDLARAFADDYFHSPFAQDNMFINGTAPNNKKQPYWMSLHKEPVCIVNKSRMYPGGGFGMSGNDNSLSSHIKRFERNRHVYLINVHEEFEESKIEDVEDLGEEGYFNPAMENRQYIYALLLEHTASLVEIKSNKDDMKVYYRNLFDSWADELGVKLGKGLPKEKLIKQILGIHSPSKSELMEKVYKYILSQEGVGDTLTIDDFAIVNKFNVLGASEEKKDGKFFTRRMEDTLIGLDAVKEQVYSIVDVMKYNKKRETMGCGAGGYHNVHLMLGAPGTAKTTVARLMGNIMMEQKLLPGNRFVSINGADLKGMYVGHSAPKTKAYFDNYDVILIDEAYSLTSDRELDSFSQEALSQLIIELEKHGMDKLVIFAGYGGVDVSKKDNKMLQFLEANPGIRSRINSTIYFKSYTPEEMVDIVHCQARNNKFSLTHEADEIIRKHFESRYKKSDFGNGREARSLLENITVEAARRVMNMDEKKQTKKVLKELLVSDVETALKKISERYKMQNGNNKECFGFI